MDQNMVDILRRAATKWAKPRPLPTPPTKSIPRERLSLASEPHKKLYLKGQVPTPEER